jgi:hypothetical protein
MYTYLSTSNRAKTMVTLCTKFHHTFLILAKLEKFGMCIVLSSSLIWVTLTIAKFKFIEVVFKTLVSISKKTPWLYLKNQSVLFKKEWFILSIVLNYFTLYG